MFTDICDGGDSGEGVVMVGMGMGWGNRASF